MGVQITIRDVPEKVRDELAARAATQGRSHSGVSARRARAAGRTSDSRRVACTGAQAEARVADAGLIRGDPSAPSSGPTVSAVVDTSILVAALVDAGAVGGRGRRLRHARRAGTGIGRDSERAAPTRTCRKADRCAAEAQAAYRDLMQVRLELFSFEPFAERIWRLRHNMSCYDAWYVALAEALSLPLATLDRRLSSTSGPTCAFLVPPRR
jgi:predicted nucleic acid-binding protein/plasmid stability protein